jgi:hypothetical protein
MNFAILRAGRIKCVPSPVLLLFNPFVVQPFNSFSKTLIKIKERVVFYNNMEYFSAGMAGMRLSAGTARAPFAKGTRAARLLGRCFSRVTFFCPT